MNVNKNRGAGDAKMELQIAPLIDVVFLLLIYFLVTASLIRKEGDLGFILPANVSSPMTDLPVEALILISGEGQVSIDGKEYPPDDIRLDQLVVHVNGLKQIADSQQSDLRVTITPNRETIHTRIINVMDACADAGVEKLSFGKSTM